MGSEVCQLVTKKGSLKRLPLFFLCICLCFFLTFNGFADFVDIII